MMEGSVKGPVSVAESADDEDDEDGDLGSALDVLGMMPLTEGIGLIPTNAEYNRALYKSLRKAGT